HRSGRRRGTAVSDERIMPVLYSPLIMSAPSTPNATTAKMVPLRLVLTALMPAGPILYWLAVTGANEISSARTAALGAGLPSAWVPARHGSIRRSSGRHLHGGVVGTEVDGVVSEPHERFLQRGLL